MATLTLEGAAQLEAQTVGGGSYTGGSAPAPSPVIATDTGGGYVTPSVAGPEIIASAPDASQPASSPDSCDSCGSSTPAAPGTVPLIGTGGGFISAPAASFSLADASSSSGTPAPSQPATPAHTPAELVTFLEAHGGTILLLLLALALLVALSNTRRR